MSELSILKTVTRAEERTLDDILTKETPPNRVTTKVGRSVDISRGYNVRGPDGVKIPFNKNTPLDKAKQWTKNFYNPGEVNFQPNQSFGNRISLKADEGSFIDFKQKEGGPMQVTMSKVTQKGAGVGAGLYRKLFERAVAEGVKVESDRAMSEGSVNVWLRFKELGYPIVEHPRKKMMSGGFENAQSPNKPLFEFDPSKPMPGKTLKPIEVDPIDRMVHEHVRGKPVGQEQREALTAKWLDYKNADDAAMKERLGEQIKTMLAPKKSEPE